MMINFHEELYQDHITIYGYQFSKCSLDIYRQFGNLATWPPEGAQVVLMGENQNT